jgi:uncharacterized protein YndB with AHSA1/START domain
VGRPADGLTTPGRRTGGTFAVMTTPELSATIEIDAAPAQVWALIADLPRMREWSDQVVKTKVVGGEVKVGARMVNLNQQGWKRWPTTAKVVRCTPHADLAFRVAENKTVWSYQLEPIDGGARTRVTHRRETPEGISSLSKGLTKVVLGGMEGFTAEMGSGMQTTLERIKTAAER